MIGAFERGLCLSDFEYMTIGMIIDYIITYNNERIDGQENEEDTVRIATQKDFDLF